MATTALRIYAVRPKADGKLRLVRTAHPAIALRHVAGDSFDVTVATQEELVSAIEAGTKVEDPKADAQQALPGTD